MKKRLLALNLALLLLLAMFPMQAGAAGATFTLNQTVTTSIPQTGSANLGQFTPTEAGWYRFYSETTVKPKDVATGPSLALYQNDGRVETFGTSGGGFTEDESGAIFYTADIGYLETGNPADIEHSIGITDSSKVSSCVNETTVYKVPDSQVHTFIGNTASVTLTPGGYVTDGSTTHIFSYTPSETGWYAASVEGGSSSYLPIAGDYGVTSHPTRLTSGKTYHASYNAYTYSGTAATATITMNQLTIPTITVGTSDQSAFVSSGDYYLASFTPTASGRYVFAAAKGNTDTYIYYPNIYQEDGSEVSLFNTNWTEKTCSAFLTANETYIIDVNASNYNGTPEFTLTTARDIAVDEKDILSEANAYGLLRYAMDMSLSGNVTRLDLAMILASAAGLEVRSDDTELSFTDCGDLSDAEKAVLKACVTAGIFSGTSSTTFAPTATATRAEVAAAISRLSDINDATTTGSDTFTDVESDAWYHDIITKLLNLQILPDTDTFSPNMVATRKDVLEWLVRACKGGYLNKAYVLAYAEGRMGEDSLSIKVGKSVFLICSAYYVTGNGSFIVLNSNPDVAEYDAETNSITGLSAGTTTVSVIADNGAFAKCKVRVTGNTVPSGPSGGSSTPSTSDPVTTENPDGSKTTTETAEDGTVTATTAWDDGQQAVAVKSPEGEKTITVTTATGEKVADVKIPAKPAEGKEFADVKDGAWYESAVDTATGYGLFNGTTETKFSPNDGMTRGMLATVLYNLSGKPEYGTDAGAFNDVETGKWYEDPVDWAYKAGVTSGTSDTEFSPNKDITREQLVTMLYRYAEKIGAASKSRKAITGFPDGNKVAGYAKDAMQWAVAEGFISGRADGGKNYIAPQGTASRAEVAAILTRFVEYLKK